MHFALFDFLSSLVVIGLLVLTSKLFVKALDYETSQYEIAKAEAQETLTLDEKVCLQYWSRSHDYPEPQLIELKLITEEEIKQKQEEKAVDDGYLGRFRITHYCDCETCQGEWTGTTATGRTPTVGRTIAVDPRVIPLGTKVVINGHTYTAEDTGGAIRGNRIDIFVGSHEEANRKGVYYTGVYKA